MSDKYGCSTKTLRRKFDAHKPTSALEKTLCASPVPLVFDGTFFGRTDGFMVYRTGGKNLYWRKMDGEKIAYIEQDLLHLKAQGWQFSSFTIDGRNGVIQLLKRMFPGTPIQLCHFHQQKTIRKYITMKPKMECGKEIKKLMAGLKELSEASFIEKLQKIKEDYTDFLKERNENKQFKHRKIRSALRSLTTNLAYLFAYKKHSDLNIPNTTNSCDGSFAHWKQKTKIHRGLKESRRDKMIEFLLHNSSKNP